MGATCSNTCVNDSCPQTDRSRPVVTELVQSEAFDVHAPLDGVELGHSQEPRRAGEADVDRLLESWQQHTTEIKELYVSAMQSPGKDEAVTRRIEEAARKVQAQMRDLQLARARQSWESEEAKDWLRLYTGKGMRRKSFLAAATKVKIENSIVRHWKNQVSPASRGDEEERMGPRPSLAKIAYEYEQWDDVDMFEVCKRTSEPLTQVAVTLWDSCRLNDLCRTNREKVVEFFRALELNYKENPFHNGTHAADVTLAGHYFWTRLSKRLPGYFTQVDLLVVLVATTIHDVAHPSVNNDYLVKTKDELAIQYNDRSVLENMHAATGFRIMRNMGVTLLEHNLPSPPAAALRSRVIDMVLATDMAKHKEVVEDLALQVSSSSSLHEVDKLVMEKHLVHMADLAHPLREMKQHREWTRRLSEEFFAQGDLEKKLGLQPMALFDRVAAPPVSTGQVGFLTFVITPCWRVLHDILHPEDAEVPDGHLRSNLAQWQTESKAASPPGTN
mmetsp:Transcript_43633/g.79550  ORF Transcript_43633/g.79550 Transcript_43633/m.79550 type:complete len:501 (+) Transcript_43633:92-1594(+)